MSKPKSLTDRDALVQVVLLASMKGKELENRWVKGGMPLVIKEAYDTCQAVQHWAGLKLAELNDKEFPKESYAECEPSSQGQEPSTTATSSTPS